MYKEVVSPALEHISSETGHNMARKVLHLAESTPLTLKALEVVSGGAIKDPRLETSIGETILDNPVMVGAGWDKNGVVVKGLQTMGFSAVEVGSVLAYKQPGNGVENGRLVREREFIIDPDHSVSVNWMGFNSEGMHKVGQNLEKYALDEIPVGINIGKNKLIPNKSAPQMYAAVVDYLYDHASYFVVNVSSPNTPELRKLQSREYLTDIVQACLDAMNKNGREYKDLFIKVDPDMEIADLDDVIRVVMDTKITGIVATNTTQSERIKAKYGEKWRDQPGGLAGNDPDYRRISTDRVAHIFRETKGAIEIIGSGGVNSGEAAVEKMRAGAKAVQVVTAIRERGPRVAHNINKEIVLYLDREGVEDVGQLVGADHQNLIV